jgi:hypothetical protein
MRTSIREQEIMIQKLSERIKYLFDKKQRLERRLKKQNHRGWPMRESDRDNIRFRKIPLIESTIRKLKPRLTHALKRQKKAKSRYYAQR